MKNKSFIFNLNNKKFQMGFYYNNYEGIHEIISFFCIMLFVLNIVISGTYLFHSGELSKFVIFIISLFPIIAIVLESINEKLKNKSLYKIRNKATEISQIEFNIFCTIGTYLPVNVLYGKDKNYAGEFGYFSASQNWYIEELDFDSNAHIKKYI